MAKLKQSPAAGNRLRDTVISAIIQESQSEVNWLEKHSGLVYSLFWDDFRYIFIHER